jgi:hypothetical protein
MTKTIKQDVRNDFIDRVLTKCGWSTLRIKRTHGESRQSRLERSFSQPLRIQDQDDHEAAGPPRRPNSVTKTQ